MIASTSQGAASRAPAACTARPMQHQPRAVLRRLSSSSSTSGIYVSCNPSSRLGVASGRPDVRCLSSSLSSLRTLQDTRSDALAPSRNWFVESVPSIVSRISNGTSSLHVVHARSKGAPQIFHSDLSVHATPEESWQHCSARMLQEQADGVVLIRPISGSSLDYCPMQLSSPTAVHVRAMALAPSALDSPPSSPRSQAQQQAHSLRDDAGSYSAGTRYYGVVVQSGPEACSMCPLSSSGSMDGMPAAGCDGCYVLKLCKSPGLGSGSPGCTHYTLTRVCRGRPLNEQLWEPWLSSQ